MKTRGSPSKRNIRLKTLNELITCRLCRGYLVDAVSITECLHTFCKSCIVKYLKDKNDCPSCKIMVHQSHPLNYISIDRTLQNIVYKVVPNLFQKEKQRREDFYRKRGISPPPNETFLADAHRMNGDGSAKQNGISTEAPSSTPIANCDPDFHRKDEQVNICLESGSSDLPSLNRKFLRISSMATVMHLRKYVAKKVFNDISRFKEIDIFFKRPNDPLVLLGKDHLLKFINVIHWRTLGQGDNPMPLQYVPHQLQNST